MGKLIKVILILFSSVALLIVAAAIIIPLVVDVNDYKPEMEVAVQERTGRTLKIEGDLNLSVFPWLGVSTGRILLGNAPGFAENPFAVIGKADIKVKLLPLFSKKVEVSTIVLKDLEVYLEKNKQGISNWYDLTAKPAEDQSVVSEKQAGDADAGLADIEISGLVVENSLVSWDDQQSGQHVVVKDFNFSSGAVVFNEPIAIKIAFLLENSDPVVTEQLTLSTSLVIDETLQKIQLNSLQLSSVTKGESVPGGVFSAQLLSAVALDLEAQTLTLKNLHINTDTIKLTGNISTTQLKTDPHYAGTLQIEPFSPKSLMQQLAMSVPETTDKNVLQKLAMSFDLQGTKNSVALEKLTITLDDTQINGYTRIKQFNQPEITFQLAIDDIDMDRYSAPKQKSEPEKTPVAKAKAAVTEATLLPMDTLRTLNMNGDLTIAKLKAAKLKMEGVHLNIQAKHGIVKIQQTINQLYQGKYQGQIAINAQGKSPSISLDEKITRVQLEPLLNDLKPDSKAKLKGAANITANLNTTGNTMTAIKSGLDGTLNFSLDNGAVRGFNLQKIIDVGRLAIKGKEMQQNYADEQTLFTVIKGSATVKKGVINNPDFLAESSTIEVKGGGTANLVNEALDYKVIAKTKKGGKNIADRPIALKVQGTFSEPSYTVDLSSIESMMTEEEKQKVDKFIDKREKDIDKALGEGTGKAVNKLLKGFF